MSGTGIVTASSNSSGSVVVALASDAAAPLEIVLSGAAVVERHTKLRVPGPDATISLIPGIFDLRAFDEMFRVPLLLRWTTPPPLLVETRAGMFADINAPTVTAIADEMSDAEYQSLVADLTWALPQLTGDTFGRFATVKRQTSSPDATVRLDNDEVITVARLAGLTAATGYWGYARWQFETSGEITSGIIMLDRDFERSNSRYRRSLRAHELGHALGYNHVATRPSVMNSTARLEPTDWDRDACRIAFQRPPGNRSPDTDPSGFSTNRATGPGLWSPAVF